MVDANKVQDHELLLDGDEGRHAVSVRRIRIDEQIHLTDGHGQLITGTVISAEGKDRLLVRVLDRTHTAQPQPTLTVVQAIIKGDRGELAVEMLTEAGVDRIIPWSASRCVADWSGKSTGVDKWRRTAREASKQSRRTWFPVIEDVATTNEVAQLITGQSVVVVLHESAHQSISQVNVAGKNVVVIVGPEGGLTDEEVRTFVDRGAHAVTIGPTVLRASTAATAVTGLLMNAMGRW